MRNPALRTRPGREHAQAYGSAGDDAARQGVPAEQDVSIVVSGIERVDHIRICGSAGRVPVERATTPTCTKEARRAGKVIGKGKGSKGRTPGGPTDIAITNAPWHTQAPLVPTRHHDNAAVDQRRVKRFQTDPGGTDSDQDSEGSTHKT